METYFSGVFVVMLSRISVFSRKQSVLYHVFTLVGVQKCKWLSGCLTQLSGNALHQLSLVLEASRLLHLILFHSSGKLVKPQLGGL